MRVYVIKLTVDMRTRDEQSARRVANAMQAAAENLRGTSGIHEVRILEHRLQRSQRGRNPAPVFVRKAK